MNRDQAVELIRNSPLFAYAESIVNHLSPSVRIIVVDGPEDGGDCSSTSYFGGQPSLPANAIWPAWDKRDYLAAEIASLEKQLEGYRQKSLEQPEANPDFRERQLNWFQSEIANKRQKLSLGRVPLAFLGQVSLREVNTVAQLPGWPREGVLAFFYDASQIWGFDPLDRGHCQVLFYPEDVPFTPAEFPRDLEPDARFPKASLKFRCEWTLPEYLDLNNGEKAVWRMDGYLDLLEKLNSSGSTEGGIVHRVGGHPQEIQEEMRLECQLVTNGIYCGDLSGYKDPRRAELEKGASDWQLLAQFDSDEARLGWMWGDGGRVYFWARRQDMETANFTNSWAILQCG